MKFAPVARTLGDGTSGLGPGRVKTCARRIDFRESKLYTPVPIPADSILEFRRETYLSAQSLEAQSNPRLSIADGYPRWPQGTQCAAREGPQTHQRLIPGR